MIYKAKSVFPAINASLRWFNNVVGMYVVQVSLLLIGQQSLGNFFRYRTLLIDWGIVPIYANAIGKQPRQRQLLLVQGTVWFSQRHSIQGTLLSKGCNIQENSVGDT
jgi:hypothetical protein